MGFNRRKSGRREAAGGDLQRLHGFFFASSPAI
jgi:hypothetical protein